MYVGGCCRGARAAGRAKPTITSPGFCCAQLKDPHGFVHEEHALVHNFRRSLVDMIGELSGLSKRGDQADEDHRDEISLRLSIQRTLARGSSGARTRAVEGRKRYDVRCCLGGAASSMRGPRRPVAGDATVSCSRDARHRRRWGVRRNALWRAPDPWQEALRQAWPPWSRRRP